MGVGLVPLFKKYATEVIKTCPLSMFKGQTWAIDASIYCYKFAYNASEKKSSHVQGFYGMIYNLLKNGIQPIIIFDGKPPAVKQHTIDLRKKLKAEKQSKLDQLKSEGASSAEIGDLSKNIITFCDTFYDDIKALCDLMHVKYIKAQGEADALCARLYRNGAVQCVLSEDTDLLMFGCSLIRKYKYTEKIEYINIDLLLKQLGVSYEQFVSICVLSGTDYTEHTIPKVGPMTAYSLVKKGQSLEQISTDYKYQYVSELTTAYDYILNSPTLEIPEIEQPSSSPIDFNLLTPFLTEKCGYKASTLEKHFADITKSQSIP